MTTLTKSDLVNILVKKIDELDFGDAKIIVELFFETIKQNLSSGKQVKIHGLGNLKLHSKNKRPGRNPKTGEKVEISARRVVIFHPSKKLKGAINSKTTHY